MSLSRRIITSATTLAILAPCFVPLAHAQLMNQLQGVLGQGGGSALGGVPSVDSASTGNIAGVMQFCLKNNYLSGGGAQSVGSSLLGKVNGSDSGFKSGSGGLLQTGNGQTVGLGGDGLKAQMTKKVCDLVLQHAKSLL